MKFSIIIPVKAINNYIHESMPYILKQEFKDFEIIIFTDFEESVEFPQTRIIPSGPVGPATKRDMAIQHAEGEFLAFLDDDAYPRSDWLIKAIKHFNDPAVAAVCGPSVTPSTDGFFAQLSGAFYTSSLGSGSERFRYWPVNHVKEVNDCPSVNMIVRKSVFIEIGGFDSHYWPGEDTKLCLDIVNKGLKIYYDPNVFVWHHRRNSLKKHLIQLYNYALHRGHFVKKYPKTSKKPIYFLPSIFMLYCVSVAILPFILEIGLIWWYFIPLAVYIACSGMTSIQILISSSSTGRVKLALCLPMVFLISHLFYGFGFIIGLCKKELTQ